MPSVAWRERSETSQTPLIEATASVVFVGALPGFLTLFHGEACDDEASKRIRPAPPEDSSQSEPEDRRGGETGAYDVRGA